MTRAPLGLPRDRRLRRAADFQTVSRTGRKLRDPLFVISVAECESGPRLGLVVSRRVSTKAVARNRIKRQIKESFRLHRASLGAFDIVVTAQAAAVKASNAELLVSLQRYWKRLAQ